MCGSFFAKAGIRIAHNLITLGIFMIFYAYSIISLDRAAMILAERLLKAS